MRDRCGLRENLQLTNCNATVMLAGKTEVPFQTLIGMIQEQMVEGWHPKLAPRTQHGSSTKTAKSIKVQDKREALRRSGKLYNSDSYWAALLLDMGRIAVDYGLFLILLYLLY